MQYFLQEFENQLNPSNVEQSAINVRILGYGEISTVFTFDLPDVQGWAFKRLPIFQTETEAKQYVDLYYLYNETLKKVGLLVPDYQGFVVRGHNGIWVCYLAQRLLPADSVGNRLLHKRNDDQLMILFELTIREMLKVWQHNRQYPNEQIGLDAQISNWALKDFDPDRPITKDSQLFYLDTSTPMLRLNGKEQINPLLFLKSAPPGLRFVIRQLFLQEVMDRYYDFRLVLIDLLANLYKEQRPDLIDKFLPIANRLGQDFLTQPIERKEIDKYYAEDKFIWQFYLTARKIHRFILTKLLNKRYEFILPEKIKR